MSVDSTPVKLSETCWCGTQVTIEGVTWDEAADYVTSWRNGHRHRPGREVDSAGVASAGFARETGQPALSSSHWAAK